MVLIKNSRVVFPYSISPPARDLIEKCLYKNPEGRISVKEIIQHPFFDKMLSSPQTASRDSNDRSQIRSFFHLGSSGSKKLEPKKLVDESVVFGDEVKYILFRILLMCIIEDPQLIWVAD